MDFQDSRQRRSNLPKLITRDGAEAFDETLLCHGAHLEGIRGGRLYPVSANGAALIRSLGQRPQENSYVPKLSAESAIHFRACWLYYHHHAAIAQ